VTFTPDFRVMPECSSYLCLRFYPEATSVQKATSLNKGMEEPAISPCHLLAQKKLAGWLLAEDHRQFDVPFLQQ